MKIFRIILACILGFASFSLIFSGILGKITSMTVTGVILALIAIKVSRLLPKDRERAIKKEQDKIKEKERLDSLGFLSSASLTHESGLPIAEKILCKLTYYKDKITIEGSGTTFNLQTDKLIDIAIKTTTEIENFYTSSVGGAIGGAVLLGPLGAVIGGRAKKKQTTKRENFLVITYEKEDGINFVVFNTDKGPFDAQKFVNIFKETGIKTEKIVDL